MSRREAILSPTISPQQLRLIRAAQDNFVQFCDALRIPSCTEAVSLYLTWLSEERGATGREVQRNLAALDAARRLQGDRPWTEAAEIRRLLLGLLRQHPVGSTLQRAEPLYLELVAILVEATMAPSLEQRRHFAAIALHATTGLSATALTRLRWRDVRMRKTFVELTVPPPPRRQGWESQVIRLVVGGGSASPVRALRHLREACPAGSTFVLGEKNGSWQVARVRRALDVLGDCAGDVRVACDHVSRSPQQLRDRALLLMGYGAALRTHEAIGLSQRDVWLEPRGLLLEIEGRGLTTGVPSYPGEPTDPVQAWAEWLKQMTDQSVRHPSYPAFPVVSGTRIWNRRIGEPRLNQIVQRACDRAELPGHYVFTSLRSGLIRTALRANQRANDVATHADLRLLNSVSRHQRREHVFSRSVAGQLGL